MDTSILILLLASLLAALLGIGMLVALMPQCGQRNCSNACRNKRQSCPAQHANEKARTERASQQLREVPGQLL